MMLAAALTTLWGCSSSDDDSPNAYSFETSEKPAWSVDLAGNDADPAWQDIDQSKYGYGDKMVVTVKLEDELAKHVSSDDRMVVFIGEEQRTRPSAPNIFDDGSVYFVLNIGGNSSDREINIRLCYWCAQLRQLFTIEEKSTFRPELSYGNTSDYVPPLLKGCKKYPVQNELTVNAPESAPFAHAEGDLVAAFAGNECRGAGTVGEPFTVFRTSADEVLQVRYYSVQQSGVYSLTKSIDLGENGNKTVISAF